MTVVMKRLCDGCGAEMPMYPEGQTFVVNNAAVGVAMVSTGDFCDACRTGGGLLMSGPGIWRP